jgi:outer membrane immunogenic protein
MKTTLAAAAAILIATTAASSAADMAVKASMIAPASIWDWTGFYVGGHVGAGWEPQNRPSTRL